MIKWIKVRNPYNEELTVTLTEAEPTHGLLVKEITGLGSKASLSFTDYVILDGSVNTNARVEKRTIGINFLLAFAPDIESSRRNVYRYFPIKGKIRFWVGTDYRVSYIDGIVESIEPGIFAEEEEVNVSIVCEDPYFRSEQSVIDFDLDENFNATSGKRFEFPFVNNSLIEKQLEFSESYGRRTSPYSQLSAPFYNKVYELNYPGDVETGATFKVYLNGNHMSELKELMDQDYYSYVRVGIFISNASNGKEMVLNLTDIANRYFNQRYLPECNHMIEVSTSKSKKKVTYYHANGYKSDDKLWPYRVTPEENAIVGFFSRSNWLTLVPGDNVIKIGINHYITSDFDPDSIQYHGFTDPEEIPDLLIGYDILYQGV